MKKKVKQQKKVVEFKILTIWFYLTSIAILLSGIILQYAPSLQLSNDPTSLDLSSVPTAGLINAFYTYNEVFFIKYTCEYIPHELISNQCVYWNE